MYLRLTAFFMLFLTVLNGSFIKAGQHNIFNNTFTSNSLTTIQIEIPTALLQQDPEVLLAKGTTLIQQADEASTQLDADDGIQGETYRGQINRTRNAISIQRSQGTGMRLLATSLEHFRTL